jgi:hypothetical protein
LEQYPDLFNHHHGSLSSTSQIPNEKKRMLLNQEDDAAEAGPTADLYREEMTDRMISYPHEEKPEIFRVMDGATNFRVDTHVKEVLRPV